MRLRSRKVLQGFILALVTTIGACFVVEVLLSRPVWGEVVTGFIPRLAGMDALYGAIGILGATVMPHNLYLHSALEQTRQIVRSEEGMRQACRYNLIDSAVALNCAFFVNASIMVLAAITSFGRADQRPPPDEKAAADKPYVLDCYIAGYIGYLELEKLAKRPPSAGVQRWLRQVQDARIKMLDLDPRQIRARR